MIAAASQVDHEIFLFEFEGLTLSWFSVIIVAQQVVPYVHNILDRHVDSKPIQRYPITQ